MRTLESVKNRKFSDNRPYGNIKIEGVDKQGLLDSGADISVLGNNALDFLNSICKKYTKITSKVSTSDGTSNSVVGIVNLNVKYKGLEKQHRFYIVPTLSQEVYLGFDFWIAFNIAPELHDFRVDEISSTPDLTPFHPEQYKHDLTTEQTFRLDTITKLFPSSQEFGLGRTPLLNHFIDTGTTEPIKSKCYPVSPKVQELMYEELDRMLSIGAIEEAESPWNNPVVLVRKPGKNRLCLDSRKLNSVTKKMAYAIPNINGLLSRLADTHFISCIDLKDAFWQIELEESSKEKTAFTVPGRPQYQFRVMPFGLCNAAQRLCQLMDRIFPVTLQRHVFVYLDDLLVVSSNFEEHISLLSEVAKKLRRAGLTINTQKSRFCYKEAKYLGHIVGHGTLRPDPEKVSAIVNFPVPSSVKQVRRFMGMCGYYGKFIENYSALSSSLTDLIKKRGKFVFPPEALTSFEQLKSALIREPVLVHPDFEKPFFIHCDASRYGVGACLMQKDFEGNDRAISYFSKKLNKSQKNYSVTELECLAAILAVEKFRPYIELHEFTIITDHSALKWLMSQKDLNGRLARWSLRLQRYEFSIQHRKGQLNVVPDTLSREGDISEICHNMPVVDLKHPSFTSHEYLHIRDTIHENSERLPDLKTSDGYVYKRVTFKTGALNEELDLWKLWVPTELTHGLIEGTHNSDDTFHGGSSKTLNKLRQLYFWPKMYSQVYSFVGECEKCKSCKTSNKVLREGMGKTFDVQRPFQHLYMDFLGPYPRTRSGNTHLLVILDQLTKYPIFTPIRKATAMATIDFLNKNVFSMFDVPEEVFTDNGTQFVSKTFEKFLSDYGVKHLRTPVYSPQSNASERLNRSIVQGIRLQIKEHHNKWDEALTSIAFTLRSTIHETIGMSPHFALFGNEMICHGSNYELLRKLSCLDEPELRTQTKDTKLQQIHKEIMDKIHLTNEKNANTYNLRSRNRDLSENQLVFRRLFHLSDASNKFVSKFAPKFEKCRIKKVLGNSRYVLEDLNGKTLGTYHSKDLKT